MIESRTNRIMLKEQLDRMVDCGFPDLLEIPKAEYQAQVQFAINRTSIETGSGELLSITEPRIPFVDQLKALGLEVNPALYYQVQHSAHRPYVARLQLIHPYDDVLGGYTYQEMITRLPSHLRPASPFEGLVAYQDIVARGMAVFPGGRYARNPGITGDAETLQQYHCLERFLGRPRISFLDVTETDIDKAETKPKTCDYLVSLAVARRGHVPTI